MNEIDIQKLVKLDKLLVKMDLDFRKKKRDLDKTMVLETMKKVRLIWSVPWNLPDCALRSLWIPGRPAALGVKSDNQ